MKREGTRRQNLGMHGAANAFYQHGASIYRFTRLLSITLRGFFALLNALLLPQRRLHDIASDS